MATAAGSHSRWLPVVVVVVLDSRCWPRPRRPRPTHVPTAHLFVRTARPQPAGLHYRGVPTHVETVYDGMYKERKIKNPLSTRPASPPSIRIRWRHLEQRYTLTSPLQRLGVGFCGTHPTWVAQGQPSTQVASRCEEERPSRGPIDFLGTGALDCDWSKRAALAPPLRTWPGPSPKPKHEAAAPAPPDLWVSGGGRVGATKLT